eukprot:1161579-Pelagomonas_calceolata.AAC.9
MFPTELLQWKDEGEMQPYLDVGVKYGAARFWFSLTCSAVTLQSTQSPSSLTSLNNHPLQ